MPVTTIVSTATAVGSSAILEICVGVGSLSLALSGLYVFGFFERRSPEGR